MIGGRTPEGDPTRTIWRYSLPDRTWDMVAQHAVFSPSGEVLAVAYDERARRLFVLDVEEQGSGKSKLARLIAYDLREGTSERLATFPYGKLHDQIWLAVAEDGTLVLVAGGKEAFTAWRLVPQAKGSSFAGVLGAPGHVLGQPTMGERDPLLPVVRKGKVEYVELAAGAFHGHQPCAL